MNDILELLLIFAGWIVLARYVLPALGVPTCMSGHCRTPRQRKETETEPIAEQKID
ncbi:MAG: hypothetical protein U5R06_19215 [candidate division KSB1 bacterium]|nr:hypothetical protein [candidate division KSB1 bacterium]